MHSFNSFRNQDIDLLAFQILCDRVTLRAEVKALPTFFVTHVRNVVIVWNINSKRTWSFIDRVFRARKSFWYRYVTSMATHDNFCFIGKRTYRGAGSASPMGTFLAHFPPKAKLSLAFPIWFCWLLCFLMHLYTLAYCGFDLNTK